MREPEFNVFTLQSATAWATGRSTCLVFRDSGGVQLSSDGLFEFAEGVPAAAVGFDANGELWFVHGGTGDLCRIRDQRERDAQAAQASPGRGCDAKESLYCRISPFSVDTDQESVARPANIVVAATKIWLADSSGGRVWGLLRPTLQVGTMIDLGSPIASLQVDRCGDLYVLTISHSIHRYDRDGHSETVLEPPPIEGAELPWRPTAIATDREGNLFVVDQNNHVVLRRHGRGDWAVAFSLPAPLRTDQPLLLTVDRLGIVYVGDPRQKTVSGEPRWFVTMFGLGGDVIGTLHSILGPFRYLLTDHQGGVYGFNTAGQLVVLSGSSASYATEGSFTSPVFDSRDTETSWHRVALDAEQNERTRLEVEAFITNTEPDDIASIPEEDWKLILHSPFEGRPAADGLFDDMVGQFCVLRLRLQGDGGSTPVVSRLRVFFPEQSYLRYLPAIYGEDPIGSRNMRRFLSLFESVNWEFDQEILNLARRFDLQVGSGEFIDWMATWLALAGDANWPLDVRRRVLSGSYALFEKRGTLDGLRDLVRLYTGSPPSITFDCAAPSFWVTASQWASTATWGAHFRSS